MTEKLFRDGRELTHLRDNVYFYLFNTRLGPRRRYFLKVTCGWCDNVALPHLTNFKRHGKAFCSDSCLHSSRKGPGASNWSGGRKFKRGKRKGHILVYCPDHPNARKGYVPEHRLVVEKLIGRLLIPQELVHHIDCDPQNNAIDNLVIRSNFTHNLAHASIERCVPELMKRGVLGFDKEKNCYFVK